MAYALITGASSGLGYESSKILAKRGFNLIIVARRSHLLRKIKIEIEKKYKRKVIVISKDLSILDEVYLLYEQSKKYQPEILINNAGIATYGNFLKSSLDLDLKIIELNIKCTHILTKLFLNDMIKMNKGRIMNTSSVSGFYAVPNMSTYASTKAYSLHLTEAIAKELQSMGSKVTVTAFCPGGTATGFNERAGLNNAPGVKIGEVPAKPIAQYGIKCMMQGKILAVPGILPKIYMNIYRFITRKALRSFVYYMFKNKST